MLKRIIGWFKSERGQDVMEYAMLTGAIALVIAVALLTTPISTYMQNFATTIGNCVNIAADPYICPN